MGDSRHAGSGTWKVWVGALEEVGIVANAAKYAENGDRYESCQAPDNVPGRESLPAREGAQTCLADDAAPAQYHRNERDHGGSLLRPHDLMEESLTNRRLDSNGNSTETQKRYCREKGRDGANSDKGEREAGRSPQKQGRPPATPSGDDLDDSVANHHRHGEQGSNDTRHQTVSWPSNSRKYGCQAYQAHANTPI